MSEPSRAVLITGCSSGIGHATAERLATAGWPVYATARRAESIADLADRGCVTLGLDVTDEQSMRAAVAAVEEAEGAVGVLVNNAGYSQSGAVESVPMDRIRAQFETNVFGLVRMCQLALPGMRRQRWGRIVNVSSMGGRMTFPGGGTYHATKHAVEAFSDALRFEVRGFGIEVVVIEPGLIKTRFGETAAGSIDDATPMGTTPTPASTARSAPRRPAFTRGRWRGWAAGPRRWRGRSSGRSPPAARRPATRSPRRRGWPSPSGACSPTAPGTRSCAPSSPRPAS